MLVTRNVPSGCFTFNTNILDWVDRTKLWLCHKRSGMMVNEGGWKISMTCVVHFIAKMVESANC